MIYHILNVCGLQLVLSNETDLKQVNSKTHFPKRSIESGYGSAYVAPKILCIYMYNSSKSNFYPMIIFIPLQAIVTM